MPLFLKKIVDKIKKAFYESDTKKLVFIYYKKYSTLFFIYGLISDDLGIILATYAILVSIFVNL